MKAVTKEKISGVIEYFLIIVPIFYTLLRRKAPRLHELDAEFAAASTGSATPHPSPSHGQTAHTPTMNGSF